MFQFFLGRALLRWLENSDQKDAASQKTDPAYGPAPTIDLAPPETISGGVSASVAEAAETVYPVARRRAMGSLFEVYLAGQDREMLLGAAEEALNEVERLERQWSHYRDDSDIARLNIHAPAQWVRLEPSLYHLLRRCADIHQATHGAFDITVGRLIKAWGFYRGEGRVPPEEEIETLLSGTGMNKIAWDDEEHLVHYLAPELEITLGAVGKGAAIDAAAQTLRFYGVENAVLHGGHSTIAALGAPPDGAGWEFAIKDPRDQETVLHTVTLRDESLSTSGSYEQFFTADGTRYSHILDPRTGRPTNGMLSVSVIAPSAADSDALSTAFFVMGREATQEFCRAYPELRVIIMEEDPDEASGIRVTRLGMENA